jgi:hypothetical protein
VSCEFFKTKDGAVRMILCSRGRKGLKCNFCKAPAEFECDAPKSRRKSGTCDKRMCAAHRTKLGDQQLGDVVDTIDICPDCDRSADIVQAQLEMKL